MAEEDKEFEVVDKRKVKMDSEGNVIAEPEEPQAEPGVATAEEEFAGLPPVDVYGLLKSFISLLGMHVWQWLGLIKNPVTGSIEKDLTQAKIAIDTISLMVGQIEGKLDSAEQREIQAMLSDLRMNFVQQSAKDS